MGHMRQSSSVLVHLLVAGNGTLMPAVRRRVENTGLKSYVTLFGSVTAIGMHDLMAVSDVFLMPSVMEGLSIALIEAMAMGLVPVITDLGGQTEIANLDAACVAP